MDKLKDLLGYLVAIIVLLAIAYFTGILKGFRAVDFQNAYNEISNKILQSTGIQGENGKQNGKNGSSVSYSNYRTLSIPDEVFISSSETGFFSNVFKSPKKVVFYIFDEKGDEFHNAISNYVTKPALKNFYNLYVYNTYYYKNYSVGESVSFSKICNSLQECNDLRRKSRNYSKLANFITACSRTICVINPGKKQYITLSKRNINDAKQLLERVKNW